MSLFFRAGVLLALSLLPAVFLRAQPQRLAFEHFTIEDGLPDQSVFSILQDHLGFLWLGTGDGLVCYDGYTLRAFEPDPHDPHSIARGIIHGLYEDDRGDLWLSIAAGGLNRFDRTTERFIQYRHDPGDPHTLTTNHIDRLAPDGEGHLWVASPQAGLNRVDIATGRVTRYRHNPDDPGRRP